MKKKLIIAILAVAIIGIGIYAMTNTGSSGSSSVNIDVNALEDGGNLIVDSESLEKSKFNFHTESGDANSILVRNAGKLKLENSLINKSGDTQTSGDDADFYGVNSAILVNSNGTLEISDCEIKSDSKGSNGIFVTNGESSGSENPTQDGMGQPSEVTGDGQPPEMPDSSNGGQAPGGNGGGQPGETSISGTSEANIKNVKITTHSDKSRGLDATYNGKINAENVIINTDGQSCAGLATDRGEGEVHVKNSQINTGVSKDSGRGSPIIYSTGNITLENSKGTAFVSQIACIEGKNSIELSDCDLTGYGEGNRQDGDGYADLGGIFIYQSMSGDADIGTSSFIAKNSKLTIPEESPVCKEAPMFHVTNTACIIDLENTDMSFPSAIFLEVSGQNQWGNAGSNGGIAELNTENEKIDGNVIVDSISSLNWTMKNSEFKGSINSTGNTTVNVADGSVWTLTGDSSISALEVSGDIDYGEYSLTVGDETYSSSNPFKG